MTEFIIIAICLLLFITYKPLIKILKKTKGDKESLKEEIFKDGTKEEFRDFAKQQSKKLGGFLGLLVRIYAKLSNALVFIANANAKCANYLASKTTLANLAKRKIKPHNQMRNLARRQTKISRILRQVRKSSTPNATRIYQNTKRLKI
ncbi:hypothetical protein [Helicobacter sp. T3_23-1056]